VYYIDHKPVNDSNHPDRDELIEAVLKNQHIDWRHLRLKSFWDEEVRTTIDKMARRIRDALDEMRHR
jgi:hypothetical protein